MPPFLHLLWHSLLVSPQTHSYYDQCLQKKNHCIAFSPAESALSCCPRCFHIRAVISSHTSPSSRDGEFGDGEWFALAAFTHALVHATSCACQLPSEGQAGARPASGAAACAVWRARLQKEIKIPNIQIVKTV